MITVVCGIILNRRKRVLLTRRANDEFKKKWEFPGGKLEVGESYEECLSREILEELSIKVSVESLYFSYRHSYETFTMNLVAMICSYQEGRIELVDHDKFNWVIPRDLQKYDLIAGDLKLADKIMEEDIMGN
jgi:8-oxo-dGTP diphosphatase